MTPTLIENLGVGNLELQPMPCRTREQAVELRQSLPMTYQPFSIESHNQVKADILELGNIQSSNRPL
jgi:hypothetical protein